MNHCKVIALTNQKGGVAKTTTTLNLGAGLARAGNRVLLIDGDSQGNLSQSLGWGKPDQMSVTLPTIMQSIIDDVPYDPWEGIAHHKEGFDILPSNIELSGMEFQLYTAMNRENVLKAFLSEVKHEYDYILIDCMPSLGMAVINAFSAADSIIIPVEPDVMSARGIESLMKSIRKVKRFINPNLKIDGIVFTKVESRTLLTRDIIDAIDTEYGQNIHVFDTQIPKTVRVAEANAAGKSVYAYDRRCKGAVAYEQFTREVLELGRQRETKNKTDWVR